MIMNKNKIGSYVHWRYQNYLDYGLRMSKWGEKLSTPVSPIMKMQAQKKKIMIEAKKVYKHSKDIKLPAKDITNYLNFFYNPKDKKSDNTVPGLTQDQIDTILEAVTKYHGKDLVNKQVSRTLQVTNQNVNYNGAKDFYESLDGNTQAELLALGRYINRAVKQRRRSTVLDKYMKNLEGIYNRIGQNMQNNASVKTIEDLIKAWKNIQNASVGKKSIKIDDININSASFFSQLKQFYQDMTAAEVASQVQGYLAQSVVICQNHVLENKSQNVTADMLLQVLQGAAAQPSKSRKGVSAQFLDTRYADLKQIHANSKRKLDVGQGSFSAHLTEDKVDLTLTIDNINVPISLKNYNMQSPGSVHLLSGSSVLGLTQEYVSFLNHFLNIYPDRQGGVEDATAAEKAEAKQAMQLTILYKALVGGVYTAGGKTATAELFVVNDNSKGKYRVYYMKDLIDAAVNNLASVQANQSASYLQTGDFDTQTIKHDFVGNASNINGGDAQRRISNLLNKLHIMKLKVSLNKTLFSSIKE